MSTQEDCASHACMIDPHGAFDIAQLYAYGLTLPEAYTRASWEGHNDLAVKDKTFAFISVWDGTLRISCKLAESADGALTLPFVSPTGYGLGKSGWVTAEIRHGEEIPIEMFKLWIFESYKARAPKKLVARLLAE